MSEKHSELFVQTGSHKDRTQCAARSIAEGISQALRLIDAGYPDVKIIQVNTEIILDVNNLLEFHAHSKIIGTED